MNKLEPDLKKMSINEIVARKAKLKQEMDAMIKKKDEVNERYHYLLNQYTTGILTKTEYEEKIRQVLNNRKPNQWVKYYDDYINNYRKDITKCDKMICERSRLSRKKCALTAILAAFIAAVVVGSIVYYNNHKKNSAANSAVPVITEKR